MKKYNNIYVNERNGYIRIHWLDYNKLVYQETYRIYKMHSCNYNRIMKFCKYE